MDRLIFASNEKLWFTIANEGFFSDGSVFEWNFSQGSKCIMTNLVSEGEGQFYRIACDYSEKNTWFYFSQDGLINIPIGVIGKRDDLLTDHQFVDYSKEKGWLLSIALFDATNKDDDKIYYISSSGSGIELTEGNLAVWGNDDFVYFYRENTDLWRISISTKKEDLIFKPEKVSFTRRCRRDYFPPLFNKEKNLLIFSYQKSVFSHSPIEGVEKFPSNSAIIFDFKNKIYINYDNLHFVSLKWKE